MRAKVFLAAGLSLALSCAGAHAEKPLDTGTIPAPRLFEPDGAMSASIFLLSGQTGWSGREQALAERLQADGMLVVGIDLPAYLAGFEAQSRTCAYAVSSIESLSRQLQRRAGGEGYHLPIVAGIGAGGAMALAIAAQTPASTIGGTVAADPAAAIALAKPLCTPAAKVPAGTGMTYGLKPGGLPNPVDILLGPDAPADGRDHAARLKQAHADIAVTSVDDALDEAFLAAISGRARAEAETLESLPLTVVDAEPRHGLMALIISGDGGWRDIDRNVAAFLAEDGVPTVGLDALRYFWSERTPEETAADLERIIDRHASRFGAQRVLLVGYSFGANVLPRTVLKMDARYRDRIALVSLLAPETRADFRIAVTGWLGVEGEGSQGNPADDVRLFDMRRVQCVYGLSEASSACPLLKGTGVEILGLAGGHHFDGDYRGLTDHILRAALARVPAAPAISD